MSDNKIASIGKGVLYIVALIVCAIALMVCLSNEAIFVHIPVLGSIRKMGSVLYEDGGLILAVAVFMSFICPGWLLSQIIFKGNNEVRNFAVYTSAPLIIIVILSFIGYLTIDESGFLFTAQDLFKGFIKAAVLLEVYVIVGALLIMLVLKVLRKKTVNIIIGSLFVLLYFLIAICYSSVE